MILLATLTIAGCALSLVCLLALHFVSPEYQPSWRMVSEYAMAKHKWLITSFFLLWGASSIALCILLWPIVSGAWAKMGVVLLFVSGVGEIMGGLFDVKHKLHGLSFLLGVPSLPVAALLIGYNLTSVEASTNNSIILVSAHSTWISLIIMGVAMGIMMSGFKKAGIPMKQNAPVPERVPDGVIALAGYANRLLVACYIAWLSIIAYSFLSH